MGRQRRSILLLIRYDIRKVQPLPAAPLLKNALRIGFLIALLLACWLFIDWQSLKQHIGADLFLIMLYAQIPAWGVVFFTSLRHCLLVRTPPAPLRTALRAVVLAFGLNALIPGRVSETFKITYMANKLHIPVSNCLAAVVLERATDLFIIGVSGLIALSFIDVTVDRMYLYLLIGIPAALVALTFVFLKIFKASHATSLFARIYNFGHQTLLSFAQLHSPQKLCVSLGLGLAVWGCSYLFFDLIVSRAGSIDLTLPQMLLSFVIVTLGAAVPALPGSVGTYQAAVIVVLSWFGYSVEEALVLGIALNASIYLSTLPAAMIVASVEGTGMGGMVARAYRSGKITPQN